MKAFEKTHPWISFRIDLSKASPELWINLGEASSKCEHLAQVPLRPVTAKRLHKLYLAKGVAATTAIEGNTLSEEDVLKAIEGQLEVPPSKRYLKQEVDNIIAVCNAIGNQMADGKLPPLTPDLVCGYNRQALENLPASEDVIPGQLRRHSVVVGNVYRGAPAEDCPFLLQKLCDWLNGADFKPPEGSAPQMEIIHAVLKAVAAHLYLAWIHPFGDGNGRTARLLEFYVLLSAGIPSPAAHLLSNHYNQTRAEYYRQLDSASKSGGDILPFIVYAARGFVDGLREQLKFVWEQQWDVVWRNYVHEQLQGKNSPSDARQRHLALDLSAKAELVPISSIPELTPRLAKAYAGKTTKTIQRDVNVLEKRGLLAREGRQVRARREIIFSFLPLRRRTPEGPK